MVTLPLSGETESVVAAGFGGLLAPRDRTEMIKELTIQISNKKCILNTHCLVLSYQVVEMVPVHQ